MIRHNVTADINITLYKWLTLVIIIFNSFIPNILTISPRRTDSANYIFFLPSLFLSFFLNLFSKSFFLILFFFFFFPSFFLFSPIIFFNHSRTQRLISRRGPSAPSRPSWAPPELYRGQTAPTPAKPQLCLPCPCFSHTTHCSTTASLELPPNSRLRTTQGLLHCHIHTSPRAQQRHFVLVHVWPLQEQSRRLARHGGLLHSEGVKGSLQCTACSLTVDADAWKS